MQVVVAVVVVVVRIVKYVAILSANWVLPGIGASVLVGIDDRRIHVIGCPTDLHTVMATGHEHQPDTCPNYPVGAEGGKQRGRMLKKRQN